MSFLTVLLLYPEPLAVEPRLRLSSKRTQLVQQRLSAAAADTEAPARSSPGSERDAPGLQRQAAPPIDALLPGSGRTRSGLRGREEAARSLFCQLWKRKLPHGQIWEYRRRWWGGGGGRMQLQSHSERRAARQRGC